MALADKSAFNRRITRLYDYWKENMSDVEAVSVVVTNDDDVIYSKGSSLMIWLFGYELRDTILFFTLKDIFVISSKKKTDFLRPLREVLSKKDDLPNMTLLTKAKGDSGEEHMKSVMETAKTLKKIGTFSKDSFKGDLIKLWKVKLKETEVEQMCVSAYIAHCMSVKDDQELANIKKVSTYTSDIFSKHVRNELMNIVDEEKKVKHTRVSGNIENLVGEGKKYLQPGMDKESLENCYTPIVQSGSSFSLKFSATSSDDKVDFSNGSSVTVSFGSRYKSYCSNISRTILVEPTKAQQESYEVLLEIVESTYAAMKPGTKISAVYNKCLDLIKEKKPAWADNFAKNIGFGTGIEFREAALLLSPKNETTLKENMVFITHIGITGLSDGGKEYCILIGDTVVVETEGATVITPSKKKIKSISIFLKGEEDANDEEEEENFVENITRSSKRTTVIESKLRSEPLSDDKRKEHQKRLTAQLNEEAKARLSAKKNGYSPKKKMQTTVAFKNIASFPTDPVIRDLKIMVDKKHESVILPTFGVPVPYHISHIKNVSKSEEGDYVYLRINFNFPGTASASAEHYANPDATFLKETTFRSSVRKSVAGEVPAIHLNNAFRIIKEVQKKFKQYESEKKQMADVVEQDSLKITQTKGVPRLKDLYCRPNVSTKRVIGTLEAHSNGFRFSNSHGSNIDIIYNTIKFAFFQPCDKEMLIMLHFYLRHPIMIGKKKTYHISFYTEVGEIMTDLGKSSHMYDRDDIEAEHAEREMRQKLKGAFKNFIEKVENLTKGKVEFDTPFRELGFHGVPNRSSCLLQPTTHCIINVVEWPPFVIALDEVELIHFERVQFQLKNFDMVFIFKDYARKVEMINSIPMSSLDAIKEWLNSCDIKYTEGAISLNWAKVMKAIVDDPEGFFEDGGWKFLDPESDAEGEDDDEDEMDASFNPAGDDDEASEESDSDEDYSSETSDSEDSYSGSGSSEESGKDWSDLEEEAKRDDQKRAREETDDVSPRKKKKKSSAPPPKSKKKRR